MNEKFVGSFLAIPAGEKAVLAKVIFASQYFADVVALKLYQGNLVDRETFEAPVGEHETTIYYTSGRPIRTKRWKIVGHIAVSHAEQLETERTAGGEIWIEDRHFGKASEEQLDRLPKMLVHGVKLIEKYAARSCE